MRFKKIVALGTLLVAGAGFWGCGRSPGKAQAPAPTTQASDDAHSHDGWWCDEHGVPEEVCAQCDSTLVADFKAKGDWCKEHERPESQCFVCHPDKEAEFAAQYEAKYGKKPPKPHDDEGQDHEHGSKS